MSKYSTKTYKTSTVKKTEPTGSCTLNLKDVKSNQAKYDITCNNASVTNIAYKIGNGSYVGLDASSLADTVLFEETPCYLIALYIPPDCLLWSGCFLFPDFPDGLVS